MTDNKKQHYVPRFYLKRFSEDGKSICLYNIKNKLKVINANLKNQCYRKYFYGKEKIIEHSLSDIEKGFSAILSMIDDTGSLPPPLSDEHLIIVIYILTQYGRTKYSADATDEWNDMWIKHVYGKQIESEIEGLKLDNYKIGIKDVSQYSLGMTAIHFPILIDLGYKLLKNQSEEEFITSDNPVVMYNQLFSFNKFGSNVGLANKGLQIFFPISPDKVIVIYDLDIYRVGSDRKRVIEVERNKDIYNINTLQVCSCYENIYFKNKKFNVEALYNKAKPFLRNKKVGIEVFPQEDNQYRKSEILMSFREDIRTNLNLSFMNIRASAKKWRSSFIKMKVKPAVVVRNEKMVEEHQKFFDNLNKEKREKHTPKNFFIS